MSRVFQVEGRPFKAPRYGEMLEVSKIASEVHKCHPYPERPTVAQMTEWMIDTLTLWLAAIRSAWPDVPATDEEAELWLTDQGIPLHTMVSLGSGILQEYRVRLGFIAPEVVQSHADFTPPSQDAPTTC